jgi:hypothetical protein
MSRIVFFVFALFLMWRVLSALGKRRSAGGLGADSYSRFSPRQRRRRMDLDGATEQLPPEELCECLQCGTFVPRGRAISGDGDAVFCSRSCRDQSLGRRSHEA